MPKTTPASAAKKTFYTAFETDKSAETVDGIWLDYGEAGRIRILRAGMGNKRYSSMLAAKLKPYRRQLDSDTMDEDVSRRISNELLADAIIIGWEKVLDRDGKELPYTRSNVLMLLSDLPDLALDIRAQAAEMSNFRIAEIQEEGEALGNG